MAQINANLQNYDAQEGFDLLPPGWYPARVIDSEIKEGPKGAYIKWTFDVVGKPNRVWDNMSLGNEVSLKRLKTLAQCCGHKNPNFISDTEELHGLQCMIRLKVEQDPSGQYEPQNKVSAFKPMSGGADIPQAHVAEAAGNGQAQQAAGNGGQAQAKMPWE